MRVLLVEDEIKMARAVRRGLEQEGYAVDVAPDGEEAIFQVAENEYDFLRWLWREWSPGWEPPRFPISSSMRR